MENFTVKKILSSAALAALILSFSPAVSFADDAKFTDAQKKEIETFIHDYLMDNPQVIMDSIEKISSGGRGGIGESIR